jgi:hypothetical protein
VGRQVVLPHPEDGRFRPAPSSCRSHRLDPHDRLCLLIGAGRDRTSTPPSSGTLVAQGALRPALQVSRST